MIKENRFTVRKLTYLSVLTAIVILFQLYASAIKIGVFSISLVLLPIAIGACLLGPYAGAYLGFVFGFTVLISGDAAPFLTFSVFGTVIVVLLKGILAGYAAGLVYKLLEKKNAWIAALFAAVVAPVVNSGVFFLGCYVFFLDLIRTWAGEQSAFAFIVLGMIGVNFLIELLVNVLLSPVLYKLLTVKKKGVS